MGRSISPLAILLGVLSVACSGGGDDDGTSSTGGGGPSCDEYCDRVTGSCQGALAQYDNRQACMDLCTFLPPGMGGDLSGNSVACRNFAATEAAETPETKCEAAGPLGGNTCGTPCEVFCAVALKVCAGPNTVYTSEAECAAACAAFPNDVPYNSEVTMGDSLACRMYHLNVAAASVDNAVIHCPHIGPADPSDPSLPCNPGMAGSGGSTSAGTAGSGGSTSAGTAGTGG